MEEMSRDELSIFLPLFPGPCREALGVGCVKEDDYVGV
jgi:hypothetical protein